MKLHRYPFVYSLRILTRQWQKYILPFFSLLLTALTVTLALSLTGSAAEYLQSENKALIGGDASMETNFPIDETTLLQDIPPQLIQSRTKILTFSGTVRNTESDRVIPVSFDVVDQLFPLYGVLELENSVYQNLKEDELLIDRAAAKKLNVQAGAIVYVGETAYTVLDIIMREPDVLFNTFQLFPKVVLGRTGFARSGIDPQLLRGEYTYAYRFNEISSEIESSLKARANDIGSHFHFVGDNHSGFSSGFEVITRFLIVAVLITALLAAVNVYASITYLLDRLRRSLAVLRALGLPLPTLRTIVLLTFSYIVVFAGILGIALGYVTATYVRSLAQQFLEISLPPVLLAEHILLVCLIVGATGLAALIPALERLSRVSPRALLMGDSQVTTNKNSIGIVILLTTLACVPLFLLASLLLESITAGLITIASVVGAYVVISLTYRGVIEILYRIRHTYSFRLRSVIAWKRYDGLFGIISFTSLYIALTALFVLALTQTSIESFLQDDLGATVPSMYVLDVQEEQAAELNDRFPDLTLFPNVGGRIISIDDLRVQEALENNDADIDRELRREFTLTYRTDLIAGESITNGEKTIGAPGTVSVDEAFAERANIKLGSQITVSVQGFEVSAVVTNLRATDSQSGLPFFYFVFSPADLAQFPASYFGYAYTDAEEQDALLAFISRTMPNVSSIDTAEVGALVQNTVSILLLIVFYIALPPFILACALILVLVILQYGTRRRDGARLLALGALPSWIERQYVLETISTTLFASLGAYITAIAATWYVATQYLELDIFSMYSSEIAYGLLGIIGGILVISVVLWRTDKRPLQTLLAYEDNH
ncbi:MAG: putative lysophospholipase L1 biosynthesis ABC-type transport system permease subunit [Candidatus Azotimanducaceae bacterium]|jgi:predicted lysophospholipase L1 biosynthesis ABC-type transport system permease subunit